MKKLHLIISSLVIFSLSTDLVSSQNRSTRDKKKSMLRQYTFAAFTVADSNSDSVRILSYIVVPNKVLKFVKKSGSFLKEANLF